MANIVVCVELDAGRSTEASLTAVAAARQVSAAIGATVHALVVAPGGAAPDENQLAAELGRSGADKVLLVTTTLGSGADPPGHETWSAPLTLILTRFAPRLYLLPAGALGEVLGPWLVQRTRAFLLPGGRLDVRAGSEAVPASVAACRAADTSEGPESVDLAAAALPVVVTMAATMFAPLPGARPAELTYLDPG